MTPALLEIDRKYGGVYAGSSFEFSERAAAHFNAAGAVAQGLTPGEFVPFAPGHCFSIACPSIPLPRAEHIAAYGRLRVVIDAEHELRLADYPHVFAGDVEGLGLGKGVPTYIPKSVMPAGFFGRPHSIELFQGDELIFGPVNRFFHSETTGSLFSHIEDAPGKLVLEARGNLEVLAERGQILFFTDPRFGDPAGLAQVDEDGDRRALDWHMLGRNGIGDQQVFNEWLAVGVKPRGSTLVIEVELPNRAVGLAAALYSGHTRDTAFRVDAEVL